MNEEESGIKNGRLVCATTVPMTADLFLKGQLAFLRESGWEVTLVSSPGALLERAGAREGVATVGLEMEREISLLKDLYSLARWVALLVRLRPAVLSVGTPKAALLGLLAGYLLRVPRRVYVVRGLRYEGANGARRFFLKALERLVCRLATDVVIVSLSVGEVLRRDGLCKKEMLLIGAGSSNGVARRDETLDVKLERENVRRRLNIGLNEFVVGFVGRPSRDKGGDVLFAASRELEAAGVRHTVVVVGDGGEPSVKRSTNSCTISVGWVQDAQKLMCAFDVLALPTLREGFPNVVLEAGAVGVPTVTTRATGARDSVVEGVTGLLMDVGDQVGLARKLELLATSPDLRASLGNAARVRVENDFSPESIWRGLDAIYRGEVSRCSWISQV